MSVSRMTGDRGAMLIQVGISIVVLMGFMVFVFDNGLLWVARGQAQNAADAGALSGAVARAYDDMDNPPVANGVADTAARSVATANGVWGQPGGLGVSWDCPPGVTGGGCVQVDVYRNGEVGSSNLPLVFGNLLNINSHGVRATATAQAIPANAANCLKPWTVPDKWLEANSPPWDQFDEYEPGAGDSYVPPYGQPGTGFSNKDANGDPVDWGMQVVLEMAHPGPTSGNTISSGWAMALDLPNVNNPEYRSNISGCTSATVGIAAQGEQCNAEDLPGGCIGVLTGGKQGHDKAVDDIIALDSQASWDRNYDNGRGRIVTTQEQSARIVPIAVFDTAMYVSRGYNGTNGIIKVVNFLGFFIEGVCSDPFFKEAYLDCSNNNRDIVGRLVTFPGVFLQGGPNNGPNNFGIVIRLVR